MRLTLLAAATAGCFLPHAASANELLDVYRLARQNDTVLQAAAYTRDGNLQSRPIARAALLPQLAGGYAYDDQHTEAKSNSSSFVQGVPVPVEPGETAISDATAKQLSVSLNQSIFDWAAISRYRQAGTQVAIAQLTYRAAEQDLVLRASQAYFNVLAAADGVTFAKAENKAVERQLEQAKKRFEVGLSAITDTQEAQAAYDLTVAQLLQAEQALENSQQTLREITAASQQARLVPLREEFLLPGPDPHDVQAWVDRALANNYDLAAAQLGTRLAAQGVSVARAGHLPTVSLNGSYTDTDRDTDSTAAGQTRSIRQETDGRFWGVNVNLPLFAGGLVRAQVNQAQALQGQRESEEEGVRRAVERQTRSAYLGVMSGAAQVRALKQAVLSNTTSLAASETGFEVGTRTTVDVLNSQRDLFNAQRNYAAARYNYLLSILALKAAAGELTENDLAQIDALLISG